MRNNIFRSPPAIALAALFLLAPLASNAEKVEVNFTHWDSVAHDALVLLADKFNELHPEVNVTITLKPFVEYETWLKTQVVSGSAPEIMQCQSPWANDLGRKGFMVDFTDLLNAESPETGKPWKDGFRMSYIDFMRDELGRRFSIATALVSTGIYYNKKLVRQIFKEAEFTELDMPLERYEALNTMRKEGRLLPDGTIRPSTWTEWFFMMDHIRETEILNAAGRKVKVLPIAFSNAIGQASAMSWLNDSLHDALYRDRFEEINVRELNPDYKKTPLDDLAYGIGENIDGEEKVVAYKKGLIGPETPEFEWITELYKRYSKYWQKGANGAGHNESRTMFYQQKSVLLQDGSWMINLMTKEIGKLLPEDQFDWGIFIVPNLTKEHCPYVDGSVRGVGGPGKILCLNAKVPADDLKWAIRFLQYRTTLESDQFLHDTSEDVIGPSCIVETVTDPRFDIFYTAGVRTLQITGIGDSKRTGDEWVAFLHMYLDDVIDFEQYKRYMKISWDNTLRIEERKWEYDYDLSTIENKYYGLDLEDLKK